MELTEHLLTLSRQAEEKIEELNGIINRILDVPVRGGAKQRTVHRELVENGYDHETAWDAAKRLIDQRQALVQLRSLAAVEAQVLTSIADDLIGKTGRLI